MSRQKKEKFKRYFITLSLYMFICLCIFSGLFFLLINNPDFLEYMKQLGTSDTTLPWLWFILIPLYVAISVIAGLALAFFYVESETPVAAVPTKPRTVKKKTTTKKRK